MPKLSFQYVRHAAPETVIAFLARRFRYHPPEKWRELLAGGHVTVNGAAAAPERVLRDRDRIVYEPPPAPEPEIDPTFRILYEDADLLAVDKSGNIPTSPSGKYWHHCLVHVLQRELGLPQLHAVHRLDRETSGVNLFAKTREAARALGDDFHAGRNAKVYVAVLRGRLPVVAAYVNAPLGPDPAGAIRIKQAVRWDGRPARTRFRLRAVLPGASLAEVVPLTGRTHQIRAHAAYLGLPVWGDKLYGASEATFLEWVQSDRRSATERQLLHAATLTFTHPRTGRTITLRSPAGGLLQLFLAQVGVTRAAGTAP